VCVCVSVPFIKKALSRIQYMTKYISVFQLLGITQDCLVLNILVNILIINIIEKKKHIYILKILCGEVRLENTEIWDSRI
jgi:hypothetical protein